MVATKKTAAAQADGTGPGNSSSTTSNGTVPIRPRVRRFGVLRITEGALNGSRRDLRSHNCRNAGTAPSASKISTFHSTIGQAMAYGNRLAQRRAIDALDGARKAEIACEIRSRRHGR